MTVVRPQCHVCVRAGLIEQPLCILGHRFVAYEVRGNATGWPRDHLLVLLNGARALQSVCELRDGGRRLVRWSPILDERKDFLKSGSTRVLLRGWQVTIRRRRSGERRSLVSV